MSNIIIIAEIGQNHNGDISLAKEMINMCAEGGADYAKFQLYDAKDLFSPVDNPWYEYNLKTEIKHNQFLELNEYCEQIGIKFMASVFDTKRLDWLIDANADYVKIASRSIHDQKLLQAAVESQLKLIVSLGHWEGRDFPMMFDQIRDQTSFLYCVAKYPTRIEEINFANVEFSSKKYAGFSDHTLGISAPIVAICRGAKIIEKHFTVDKNMYGPDHAGSMDLNELTQLTTFRNDYTVIVNE
jgi:sialic acid synthase SpsE